jgi:hypothetical protein
VVHIVVAKTKAPAKPKTYKLNVFDLLDAIDRRDMTYYDRLSEEEKKGFHPYVVMRWLSSVKGPLAEHYLVLANELVNIDYAALKDYPDLVYRLMAACGTGRLQNRKGMFPPVPRRGRSPAALQAFLENLHPLASTQEIDMLLDQHSLESFTELVYQTDCSDKEAAELIDAFKEKDRKTEG